MLRSARHATPNMGGWGGKGGGCGEVLEAMSPEAERNGKGFGGKGFGGKGFGEEGGSGGFGGGVDFCKEVFCLLPGTGAQKLNRPRTEHVSEGQLLQALQRSRRHRKPKPLGRGGAGGSGRGRGRV